MDLTLSLTLSRRDVFLSSLGCERLLGKIGLCRYPTNMYDQEPTRGVIRGKMSTSLFSSLFL